MTGPEPYRYILIELEHPLDLGEPKQLRMICPTPEDVGLTFVSRDQEARAVSFTPFRSKRALPDVTALLSVLRERDNLVMAYAQRPEHPDHEGIEERIDELRSNLVALVYGEEAE